MTLARHAIATIERELFKDIRIEKQVPEECSLISALNGAPFQNIFTPKEKQSKRLHKEMFKQDIIQYLLRKILKFSGSYIMYL